MSELRELYQEVILDHNRNPRNFRRIESPTHYAEGYNPLCGDRVHVFLTLEDGVVRDVAFEGDGCAISTASASIMTEALVGRSLSELESLYEAFHGVVTRGGEIDPALGKLSVLAGVREFPSRVKCATLPWHTLQAALKQQARATTE